MNTKAFEKFDLTGKTALVTGGGTGLGYAMTSALMRSGAKVMIAARRESVLEEAAAELNVDANGNEVVYCTIDLADRASIDESAKQIISTLGGVDIFIANAAQEINQPVDDLEYEAIDQMYQVNVASNMALLKAFLPHMREKQWGRVIFISSIMSKLASGPEKVGMYCSSKGALNAFGRVAAVEAGNSGITVNNLNPGIFRTEMFEETFAEIEETMGKETKEKIISDLTSTTALGRLGSCEEIEGVIQLLASDAGSFITGADITMDGGMSIMLKPNP